MSSAGGPQHTPRRWAAAAPPGPAWGHHMCERGMSTRGCRLIPPPPGVGGRRAGEWGLDGKATMPPRDPPRVTVFRELRAVANPVPWSVEAQKEATHAQPTPLWQAPSSSFHSLEIKLQFHQVLRDQPCPLFTLTEPITSASCLLLKPATCLRAFAPARPAWLALP